MFDDHEPLPIPAFNGLFARGTEDNVPPDHFKDCLNVSFIDNGFETRSGLEQAFSFGAIRRVQIYKRLGEADRYLILDTVNQLWDSTNLVTPILTVVGMSDFSVLNYDNKAYITPHNRTTGVSGSFVYVYNGTGTARKAAGTAPSGSAIVVATGAGGNIEEGTHLFAVVAETNTGFITKPGPELFTAYEADGLHMVNLSNIPLGPSGTSKRYIISTKLIESYDGNQFGYELFFVPEAIINDNVTTTLSNVNFFDEALIDSADYLLELLSEIPAGLGLAKYNNRLVSYGENSNPNVIRISPVGKPETFSEIDGFVEMTATEQEAVKNAVEFRGTLYITKGSRIAMTQDIGDPPINWKVIDIDDGRGAEVFGIGNILNAKGTNLEFITLACVPGLTLFDGTIQNPELTWKIEDYWKRINFDYFNKVQVVIDSENKQIYINVPLDSAIEPNYIFYGDYTNGLNAKNIKWSIWSFDKKPTSILVKDKELYYGSSQSNIFATNPDETSDNGVAISNYGTMFLAKMVKNGWTYHFAGARVSITGSGSCRPSRSGKNGSDAANLTAFTMAASPSYSQQIQDLLNNERMALKLLCGSTINEYMVVDNVEIFAKPLWAARPN